MTEFVSGWVGGACGFLFGHPFDTLKVRQQALNHTSIVFTFRDCIRQDGLRSLMRGLSYPILSVGFINSLFFGVFDQVLTNISPSSPPSYLHLFSAGCVAGAAQLVLAVPVDLVKIRLQAEQGRFTGPGHCLRTIYQERGLRGCYKGIIPQGFRDVKASGLYFLVYSYTLDKLRLGEPSRENTGPEIFFAGGMAGLLSWQAIIYLDVVKSRIQADCHVRPRYAGMVDCFISSYRQDGMSVFGRGFCLLSVRAFLVNGTTFLGVEYFRKLINIFNK